MQLFSRNKAIAALSLSALAVLGACGDDVTVTPPAETPETVSISPSNLTLNVGEVGTLAVQISGGAGTATLASCTASSAVITVAVNGGACRVTAVAPGNATVTAASSTGKSASTGVTVNALQPAITSLAVSPAAATLTIGQNITIVPTVQPAGRNPTITYTSSNTAAATVANGVVTAVAPGVSTITVTATSNAAGFSAATIQQAVTITVSDRTPGLTSLNVQPNAITMAMGSTAPATASVAGPRASAATYTYLTNAPAIATVTGNATTGAATITAVAPGSAVIAITAQSAESGAFAASSVTGLINVTVSPRANLTIQTVTQGPIVTSYDNVINQEGLISANNPQVNQPIDINNVRDQIQVRINLQPNGQVVDSVVAYVTNQNGSDKKAAARQIFTNGTANAGDIDFFINTADFEVNWSTGAVDVKYPNGVKVLSASVWTKNLAGAPEEIQNAENNRQSVNFNNLDSWAARYVNPSRAAAQGGTGSNANLNWVGGPGTAGIGNWTIAPVFYTPARTIQTVTTRPVQLGDNGAGSLNHMGGGFALNICAARTFTPASTLPWNSTYGYGADGANSSCTGYEHTPSINTLLDARNYITVYNAIDNSNNPAPFVRRLNGYRTNLQRGITAPVPNRLDYASPTVTVSLAPQVTGAEQGWVNAVFSFVAATGESDAGVGLPSPLGQTYTWTGCATGNGSASNVSFDGLVKAIGAAGEVPECSNDFLGGASFNGPYTTTATQLDVLGNIGTGTSNRYGVDKTVPVIQYIDAGTLTGAAAASANANVVRVNADSIFDNVTSTFAAVNSTTALFGMRYRDERAGFRQDNHGSRSLTRWAPAASPLLSNVSVASQQVCTGTETLNYDGNTGLLVGPNCFRQESVVDAADPTFRRDSIAIFGNNGGTATSAGYYFYDVTVIDRAGNSNRLTRSAAIDITDPQVTGVTIPAVLQGGSQLTFNPTGSDDLEAFDGDLFLNYPTMAAAGDNAADPTVIANQNGRLRFRRNMFANWHNPWAGGSVRSSGSILTSDGLLSTPFGPGAALSSNGLQLPIGFYQRLEVVQAAVANEDRGPHGRTAQVRLPSQPNLVAIPAHATLNALNSFKPNLLGVYAFDIRATGAVTFPNRGMSSTQSPATESAYLENLFAANITQPTQVDYWATKDLDGTTAFTQSLWSWYCFSFVGSTLECRAETPTNVVNSPFSRVDYYRWKATANAGLTVADAAATAGQWIYVGSVNPNVPTNPIIQDQGVTRFWRFTFSFSGFGTANNHANNTEGAFTAGDLVRAIGVDAGGNAISTLTFTL